MLDLHDDSGSSRHRRFRNGIAMSSHPMFPYHFQVISGWKVLGDQKMLHNEEVHDFLSSAGFTLPINDKSSSSPFDPLVWKSSCSFTFPSDRIHSNTVQELTVRSDAKTRSPSQTNYKIEEFWPKCPLCRSAKNSKTCLFLAGKVLQLMEFFEDFISTLSPNF